MASLTPLSKGLIALAVIGGMASAVWHLGLKDRLGGGTAVMATPPAATSESKPVTTTIAPPVPLAPPAAPPAESSRTNVAPEPQAATPQVSKPAPPPTSPPKAENKAPESRLSIAENAEAGRKLLAAGNFAQARIHLELAVQGGDGASACRLGEMTLKGQGGIAANQDIAASMFQLAQSRNIICFASGQ